MVASTATDSLGWLETAPNQQKGIAGMRQATAVFLSFIVIGAIGTIAHAQEIDDPMCQGRESCTLVAIHEAGFNDHGDSLTVVELGFDVEDTSVADAGSWNCRFDTEGFEGGREYWLTLDGGAAPERLLTICNDGYGAAMVGDDLIEFGNNRMVQERYGGSAWRWVETAELTLQPQQLLSQYSCSAYGAWTRSVQATDWVRSVSWYAWSSAPLEEGTEWCPAIDPTMARPEVPKPYLLGLMVPGYEIPDLFDDYGEIAGLGSCGPGVANDNGLSVPIDSADPPLRTAVLLDPDKLIVRLVLTLGSELAGQAGNIRLDVARAEYEALDWLSGDRSEPSPYQTHFFSLPVASETPTSGVWTIRSRRSDSNETLLFIDREPANDMLEVNLLGLAISVVSDANPDVPLVSTVAWQDGAPAHTPAIAWRPSADGWPVCRLNEAGMLVLNGEATTNPMDYY